MNTLSLHAFCAELDHADKRAERTAKEIVAALGKIFSATHVAMVRSVQIAGVSFHNLGDAGLEFLEDMARDGRACVPSMLNPAGMDLLQPAASLVSDEFAAKQMRVIDAYRRMGIEATCTCTPYLIREPPRQGDILAWSESSAVTYANSVLGARSNREGGPSALASALCGYTALYGLHLDENRQPTVRVEVKTALCGTRDFGLLGAAIGRREANALPYIVGIETASQEELKALSAALPTYGAQPMFHIEGMTPEASSCRVPKRSMQIEAQTIEDTVSAISDTGEALDLVTLGCPHASIYELQQLVRLLDNRRVGVPVWVSTARTTLERATQLGVIEKLTASGVTVLADTCFAVAPLKQHFRHVATDSAKGCYYGRGHNRFTVHIGSVEQCVEAAVRGRWLA